MPQLDIYTFPTQIYLLAIFWFITLVFVVKFLLMVFFRSELLEKEEIYTFDQLFLLKTTQYRQDSPIQTSFSLLLTFDKFLFTPKTEINNK